MPDADNQIGLVYKQIITAERYLAVAPAATTERSDLCTRLSLRAIRRVPDAL